MVLIKDIIGLSKIYPIPSILSLSSIIALHIYWISPSNIHTANPLRMGQMYFIVFAVVLLSGIGIQEFLRKLKK
jgi:hypothetical protein